MSTDRTRFLLVALAFMAVASGLGYPMVGLAGAVLVALAGAADDRRELSHDGAGYEAGHEAFHEAYERLRERVDATAPLPEVLEAAAAARDAAPESGTEILLIDVEVARCRAADGVVDEDLRRELAGYLELSKHLWGVEDSTYGDVAYALGMLHWNRAEACLESGGAVDFHDAERLERVGQNVLQFFRPEDVEDDEDEGHDDDDGPSAGARLAAYAFQWHDLYQAEGLLGEAAVAFDASDGPGGVRAAQCRSRLAQALAVNRAPGRGVELAGEALRDLDGAAKDDPMLLGPVYTALGLGYHLQGRQAEAKIYFDRSDALSGGSSSPAASTEVVAAVRLKKDQESAETWVHMPEEAEPTIH